MDAECVRQGVDGLAIVAPLFEIRDLATGQPSLVLHDPVRWASRGRASEHDRQKCRRCEERVAGVRKPSLKVHSSVVASTTMVASAFRAGVQSESGNAVEDSVGGHERRTDVKRRGGDPQVVGVRRIS